MSIQAVWSHWLPDPPDLFVFFLHSSSLSTWMCVATRVLTDMLLVGEDKNEGIKNKVNALTQINPWIGIYKSQFAFGLKNR